MSISTSTEEGRLALRTASVLMERATQPLAQDAYLSSAQVQELDPLLDYVMQILVEVAGMSASALTINLTAWSLTQAFTLASATRDANEAIISASIIWPDGTAGVFTTDTASTTFPGAIDAWHATYAGPPLKTVTQLAVTRDAAGAVISQPTPTIV